MTPDKYLFHQYGTLHQRQGMETDTVSTYHLDNESTHSLIRTILQLDFASLNCGILVFEILEPALKDG